jgi:UDP-N-acetylmuramate dehydrogenase
VHSVRTIDRSGEVRLRTRDDFSIAYRSVNGPVNEWFVEATFEFDPEARPSMDTLKAMLARRKNTQPLGLPSCGSVFRNPPGDHAARLIEAAGLKGHRLGGAEVSEKHANFIINRDRATASDIENLIELVQRTVLERSGVDLQHEVRIVGEAAK